MGFRGARHLPGSVLNCRQWDRLVEHIRGSSAGHALDKTFSAFRFNTRDGIGWLRRRILTVPVGIDAADPDIERRMGCEQASDPLGEVHMAGFGSPWSDELGAEDSRSNALQRTGYTLRVACEL